MSMPITAANPRRTTAATQIELDEATHSAPKRRSSAAPPEWTTLYKRRTAVEREFGRLKHQYGLAALRVRGVERVRLHADLTILGRLALELAKAGATPVTA